MHWFKFDQNNSGGVFIRDDRVAHTVWIQARSADEANAKAESIGIYFDGCDTGDDCPCCGDRWYATSDHETDRYEVPEEFTRIPGLYELREDPFEEGEFYTTMAWFETTNMQLAANNDGFCPEGENSIILYHHNGKVERFAKE
jgi:hypothetical protein